MKEEGLGKKGRRVPVGEAHQMLVGDEGGRAIGLGSGAQIEKTMRSSPTDLVSSTGSRCGSTT
jgi:hypothetical protein